MAEAYQNWLKTQELRFHTSGACSRLLAVPELYSRRAPGHICLSALYEARLRPLADDPLLEPCNHSKGCGGIMRVAPLGLYDTGSDIRELDAEGARLAALTHGHPLGYLPAAVLTHILNRILYSEKTGLKEIILEARDTVCELFRDRKHIDTLSSCIDLAVSLAENTRCDRENIPCLGEGWVAEETLAISIYCALRYERNFSAGIIAAVNHDGDSDSTGAVTGNILGALCGWEAIEEKWKQDLELKDLLLEMADELSSCCPT